VRSRTTSAHDECWQGTNECWQGTDECWQWTDECWQGTDECWQGNLSAVVSVYELSVYVSVSCLGEMGGWGVELVSFETLKS
jgi:hypothetical protein